MKLVSLMAGISSRLRPFTDHYHKVLIDIGGVSLIEHQIHAFKCAGLEEVIFIVGYKADMIISRLGENFKGIKIKYIYNEHFANRNINYSLYLAKKEVEGQEFIYMEGDLLFDPHILKMLVESPLDSCLVADPDPKSTMVDTVVLGNEGKVSGLLFKEHGDLREDIKDRFDIAGEMILLIKFSAMDSALLFNEIAQNSFEGSTTLYNIFEQCFTTTGMRYITSEGYQWVEIDDHDDLTRAREVTYPGIKSHLDSVDIV